MRKRDTRSSAHGPTAMEPEGDPDVEYLTWKALEAGLERLKLWFPNRGIVLCQGTDPPEPGAIRITTIDSPDVFRRNVQARAARDEADVKRARA